MLSKEEIITLSALVWKYGDVFIDDNEIETHIVKISVDELKKRLEEKGWKLNQPFKEFPEIMIIENRLLPGEIGKSEEHLLGYFPFS